MAKKILTNLDLRGDILIGGTANTTNGYVLTSNGAGSVSWAAASGGGGGSGFTGAGTSITGITGTNATGAGTQTSASIIFSGGNATSSSGDTAEAVSGTLTIKTGDANASNFEGSATVGDLILKTGDFAYDSENGGYNVGKIIIGAGSTGRVEIGNSDYLIGGGASTVGIIDKSTSTYTKLLNLANNGGTTNVNIATGTTTPTVKIATTGTTPTVQIGTNVAASRTFNFGKNFFWQPSPPTTISTARTLTFTDLQTFIVVSSATTGNFPLPTGTLMDTNVQSAFTDMGFDWSFINTGASGSNTVTAGTAHTIVGSGAVAFGTSARFRSRRTGTNTWVTYRIS
jgi:hypothetical protein